MVRTYITVTTPPDAEPVTLTEAKLYCRIDTSDDDPLIDSLITAARRSAEAYTKRAFITQTLEARFDHDELFEYGDHIELPRSPVASIVSIRSYDADDVESTMTSEHYRISGEQRIVLTTAGEWPSELRERDCIIVQYTAGYGTSADVPEEIRTAIKAMVAQAYESRCSVSVDAGRALLDPYKVYSL